MTTYCNIVKTFKLQCVFLLLSKVIKKGIILSEIELKGWFIAAIILSVILGFILSALDMRRKFGDEYGAIIMSSWGSIFITLLPFSIYILVSIYSDGWSKVFQSPELAMAAFLIFLFSCQSLGMALSIERRAPSSRFKISILSMWCLLWLCAALSTAILIFIADEIPAVVVVWQFVLLGSSILTYFSSAAVVKLVEVGHVPVKNLKV